MIILLLNSPHAPGDDDRIGCERMKPKWKGGEGRIQDQHAENDEEMRVLLMSILDPGKKKKNDMNLKAE